MCSSSRHSVKASNVPVTPHIVVAAIFCIPNLILLMSHQNLICSASIMVIELYSFQNFIEQCWGFAKCLYHQYPASSKEINLECNVLTALESVLIIVMRWYDLISLLPHLTWLTFLKFLLHVPINSLMPMWMDCKEKVPLGQPRCTMIIMFSLSLFYKILMMLWKLARCKVTLDAYTNFSSLLGPPYCY